MENPLNQFNPTILIIYGVAAFLGYQILPNILVGLYVLDRRVGALVGLFICWLIFTGNIAKMLNIFKLLDRK
jgi:hypothetical protein